MWLAMLLPTVQCREVSGSMGGFPTLSETQTLMTQYLSQHSQMMTSVTIGSSRQGRAITAWCITSAAPCTLGPSTAARLAVVSLLHAREPMGLLLLLRFVKLVLEEHAAANTTVVADLKRRELWVLPIANPDGS